MHWLLQLKLIRLFDFYLMLAFLFSTVLRVQQYRAILGMVWAVPGRWPRLFQLVRQHRHIFLTWATFLPLVLALLLWLGHTILHRSVLTEGEDLSLEGLLAMWPAALCVAVAALAVLSFDLYGAINVAEINRPEVEKYFDQAEYWLRSWTAPVVRVFTLGYVNPRQMVAVEVQSALLNASQVLNSSLWWMSIQTALRLLFGLSLWLTYAFSGS